MAFIKNNVTRFELVDMSVVNTFVRGMDSLNLAVVKDSKTGAHYIVSSAGGITPMLDECGNPYIGD